MISPWMGDHSMLHKKINCITNERHLYQTQNHRTFLKDVEKTLEFQWDTFLKVNYLVLVWFMISTCVFSYKRHHRDDQSDGRCGSPCCLSCNPKLLQEWHAQQSHDKSFYKGMYKVRSNLSSTAHKGLLNSFWFCLGRLLTTVRSPSFCTVFLVTQELTLILRSS